jgi:hypothetical protein
VRPLLLSLLGALAGTLLAADDPSAHLVKEPEVLAIFAEVLDRGGMGYRASESAAFLVIDPAGRYRCVAWPQTNRHERQTYREAAPPFTVAILHTHPRSSLRPSAADRATAKKLGIPVFVLTPRDIWVATPEGESVPLVANAWWAAGTEAASCSTPDLLAARRQ